jgi:hypothetical protein
MFNVILAVLVIVWGIVTFFLPVEPNAKKALDIIVWIIVILWLLYGSGYWLRRA